jgi:hypothetical protein
MSEAMLLSANATVIALAPSASQVLSPTFQPLQHKLPFSPPPPPRDRCRDRCLSSLSRDTGTSVSCCPGPNHSACNRPLPRCLYSSPRSAMYSPDLPINCFEKRGKVGGGHEYPAVYKQYSRVDDKKVFAREQSRGARPRRSCQEGHVRNSGGSNRWRGNKHVRRKEGRGNM